MALNLFLLSFERSSRPFMVTQRGMERPFQRRHSSSCDSWHTEPQASIWHGTTAAHSWAHGSTEGFQNMLAWARESFGLSRVTHENSKVIFHTFYNLGWTLFHVQCLQSSCSPCNNQAPIIIHTSMGRQTPLWFHTLLHSEMCRRNSLRNTGICDILSITTTLLVFYAWFSPSGQLQSWQNKDQLARLKTVKQLLSFISSYLNNNNNNN